MLYYRCFVLPCSISIDNIWKFLFCSRYV
uniref:Uncharacterized protein n=1 Tax=Rhizophora mucronata TaxID=61149 RepID=A0A2P2P6Z7_RHIMU